MNKKISLIVLGFVSVLALTSCAINSEPEQGVNNETLVVSSPTANPNEVEKVQIDGLPIGFPDIPVISETYAQDSYTTFEDNNAHKVWNIILFAEEGKSTEITALMKKEGFTRNLDVDKDNGKVLGFDNADYSIIIVPTEDTYGLPAYVYTITKSSN